MKGIGQYYELVMSFVFGATRSSESGSDRDGLLSYSTEWHAAIIGLGAGLGLGVPGVAAITGTALCLTGMKRVSNRKAVQELVKEPWYGIGGSLIGFAVNHVLGISVLPF